MLMMQTDISRKKKNGNKYLIFGDSVHENKGLLKKICRCLEWNQKQNQSNKWQWWKWLWKRLHEN